jgi:hypothetical protein
MNIEDGLSALFSSVAVPRGCLGLPSQPGRGACSTCAADEGGLWTRLLATIGAIARKRQP